jgi:single-strand DNA-binding protein
MLNGDSVNKVILMGRIGEEPRWQIIDNSRMLCFTVLTTEKIKRHDDLREHEERHSVRIAEKLVNPLHLSAGKIVYVQGRLRTNQSVDAHGTKHYKAEIVAISVDPVEN